MKRFSVLFVLFLVCGGMSLSATAQNRPELVAPPSQHSKPRPVPGSSFAPTQPKPSPVAVSNPAPRNSARPSQASQTPRALQPLRPPRVSYNAGQLSIVAENSTLADVLNAVRQKTGAIIESPPSAARERVVISIGPAPANDVLTALLNGSKFDYIILGAEQGSGAPKHVILREQQALPAGGQPAQASMSAPMRQLPQEAPEPMEEEEFVPEPEVTEEIQSEPAVDQHGQPQSEQQQQPEQPQIKTPEQMLEELKRMQQQQLQQQQGNQPGTQPQGNEQQQQQQQQPQNQQPQDQQQQPQPAQPDNEPPLVDD